MTKKALWILPILAVWVLLLAGCESNNEVVNEAKEFCLNNWWTHEVRHSETAAYWVCILPDGMECDEWDYLDWACPNNDEKSLTIEDLERIDETNFPKGYTYIAYNMEEETKIAEWEERYPEDISHTLLIPEHATMISREVLSSGIEDGMIYTLTNAELQDWTIISILYINNPETLDYVAASVENWKENRNYQFMY